MLNKFAKGLMLVAGVGFTSQALAAPSNNELKIGISQEFETMNPLIMTMSASAYMYRLVGRSLVILTPEGKWVAQLAKEIPSLDKGTAKIVEDGGKKKVVATWEILEGAKWGDGQPVICQDFITAHTIATSNNVSVGEKENWTQVEKIDVDPKNPKKCTFKYDKAKWDFYQLAQFFPVPTHIEKAVFDKYGKQKEGYEKNSNYVRNATNPGLYNGPYVISEVKLGSHVAFAPNPHFYGKQPQIKKIIVKLIPNTGTMEANLRSGTIDMISTLGLDFDQALAFEKKAKAESLPYVVHFVPSVTYEHIDLKLDNPILKDVRVRKALLYSINREDLVKALFEGKQQVAIHNVSPKDPWFTADPKVVTLYRYSKREAGKLLDEAGWKMGADGYRSKDGKRLSLVFQTTAGNKTRELVQVYLQNQWKQAGIEVLVKNEPARVFFAETMTKRKFDGLALFAWVSSPENSPRSTVSSKAIPNNSNGWSGQNFHGWNNPAVDKNLDALDVEFNSQKRTALVHDILKAYTMDVPVLPLYYRSDISVTPKNLKNYKMSGHQFYETNNVEEWTMN
ncbi:MAG: ABC transporter substrate-binding protein [Bdellovibrio sp. ArHS]|uniref:peptide ABC transporter substrate-binding protein n=1 Tax=Bdellovibrio sp. ArHS TaxID=1569284 RepID=UPI0005829047|nr:peptide ABC transporter substrate-binding protein [Bdellovibrio sp. ArHS]KHD87099.1 MAG: ABC transporter substrate-binding protein [Bdellovibrio sp. ArHS]